MEAPKIPSFFRQRSPIKFDFEPRYYSAKKEKMEERIEKHSKEANKTENNKKLAPNLRGSWEEASHRSKASIKINVRILLYIAVLSILAYCYFYLDILN